MRCHRILRSLVLAVLALGSGAFARAPAPVTYREMMTISPSQAGLRLLGAARGADIVGISFIDLPNAEPDVRSKPGILQLFLTARPVPLGANFCTQRRQHFMLVNANPMATQRLGYDDPMRVFPAWKETTLARAPGCRLAPGQSFASFSGDPEMAMRALGDLASAQGEARSPGRTPGLQLSCKDAVDYDPDHCRGGGREALARLPLKRACAINAAEGDPEAIEVTLCTGGRLWRLRLRARGPAPGLSMLWKNAEGTY